MLQKLTLLGELGEPQVAHIIAALEVAPCHLLMVEFQTNVLHDEIDVGIAEPLLSIVEEVVVRHGASREVLCCSER
jgi:hypothetical protein